LQAVQGGPHVGQALASSPGINGILFIGSRPTGVKLSEALASHTDKILTLEMGGNSPIVVWSYSDIRAAVHIVVQSALITTGQRCSSARRLVLNIDIEDEFLAALISATKDLVIGQPDQEVFLGPMVDDVAARTFIDASRQLIKLGAAEILRPEHIDGKPAAFVTPGIIRASIDSDPDIEIFGPLLRVYSARTLDDAITIANNTAYGLSAGIVATERGDYEKFLTQVNAGIINWNQPLTGATTSAPFGGSKGSGNHRPAGYLSVDYCSRAVASIEDESPTVPSNLPPGVSY
jgi:succinylglutamic semialdehyde dehydrogenase